MNDVIVFAQMRRIRLLQGRTGTLQPRSNQLGGEFLDIGRGKPTARQAYKFVPLGFKIKMQLNAHDSVVEILNSGREFLSRSDLDGFGVLHHWRPLEADIFRRRMLETRLSSGTTGTHQIAQFLEVDLFGDIIKNERPQRPAKRRHVCIVTQTGLFCRTCLSCPMLSSISKRWRNAFSARSSNGCGWRVLFCYVPRNRRFHERKARRSASCGEWASESRSVWM